MKRICFAMCVLVIASLLNSERSAAEDQKKFQIRFGIHYSTAGSLGSSQQKEFGDILINISRAEGIYVVAKQYSSDDDVAKAFMAGEIDVALIAPENMSEVWDKGYAYYPWGTYTVNNKPRRTYCMWHLKSAKAQSAQDFIGATLIDENASLIDYLRLRDYLHSKGIDKPVWKVFKTIIRSPNQNSAFVALSMGKGDFFWDSDDWDSLLKVINSGMASKLRHTICGEKEYDRTNVIISKKTVSKENYEAMRDALQKYSGKKMDEYLKTDPKMEAFRKMLKMAKIRFVLSPREIYKTEKDLHELSKTNGWLAEAKFYSAQLEKVPMGSSTTVKSEYSFCKSSCEKSKTKDKCVEQCMGD